MNNPLSPCCNAPSVSLGEFGAIGDDNAYICTRCTVWFTRREKQCHACGDVLPEDAQHCVACGVPVGNTGITTKLEDK